ncbi:HSF-type DNA-binding domain-containing protein [Plasmodiophora brassicae]|uniref:HSF-type DNA-binding domain-containing protein n=1 Tax=Plasmodiophora brassicae TaxID=37360 RepID=A0A0G4IWU0_PLABS|nr:hypothetical protein PBRA_007430 [Plasmodiophora brassicae]SPQ97976.1 unnamed protein product [Plasmodiophora brassicae]
MIRSRPRQTIPMPHKPMFLQKAFDMVESDRDAACRWLPDGLSFIVDDVERLERESLPKYFRHSNFLSFVRQLHFYGFTKQTISEGRALFYHPNFQRQRPELLQHIERRSSDRANNQGGIIVRMQAQIDDLQRRNVELTAEYDHLQHVVHTLQATSAPRRWSLPSISFSTSADYSLVEQYGYDDASIGTGQVSGASGGAADVKNQLIMPIPILAANLKPPSGSPDGSACRMPVIGDGSSVASALLTQAPSEPTAFHPFRSASTARTSG